MPANDTTMRLELTARHLDITPTTRALVQRLVAPLLRKLNDSAVSAHVVLIRQKTRIQVELTLHARGVHFLHGQASAGDIAVAVGAAVDKVQRQAERLKDKWNTRKGGPRVTDGLPAARPSRQAKAPAEEPRVIRSRRAIRALSLADAATALDRDGVVVFRNANNVINVLFRRQDGSLGLIEPVA